MPARSQPLPGGAPSGKILGVIDNPSLTYLTAMRLCSPILRGWARLEVSGLDCMPAQGPVLLAGNHDSFWDPIAVGVAALGRRQVRALAKSSLWKVKGLSAILNGMGQIPIERGKSDSAALQRAVGELRDGACIGIFPEGTRSLGRQLRARGGIGRLAQAVPEASIVCCAILGTTDMSRFPKRPEVKLHFFPPSGGGLRSGETAGERGARPLDEIRAHAPVVAARR